jgi:hypothetical protein
MMLRKLDRRAICPGAGFAKCCSSECCSSECHSRNDGLRNDNHSWDDKGPSALIGSVLDGQPDVPGVNGNEVNQVYYVVFYSGGSFGISATTFYIETTFDGEKWLTPAQTLPFGVPSINVALSSGVTVQDEGSISSTTAAAWIST